MDIILSNLQDVEIDNILKTSKEYTNDSSDIKYNLSIGVCCDENGQYHFFDSVLKAEKLVLEKYKAKPYQLSNGSKEFSVLTQELIFGSESIYVKEKRICTIQTIGGTGAIFLILQFLKNRNIKTLYLTNPPYINHKNMGKTIGYELKYLNYLDLSSVNINYNLFLEDLKNVENNSCIILQVAAYNPCAVDIDEIYFEEIAEIVRNKNLLIIFDCAYQGFASCDIEKDVKLIKKFEEKNLLFSVCQSFSKNMSLYGERAGALHIVCRNKEERQKIANNFTFLIRNYYTSPTIHTNRLVCEILKNKSLRVQWEKELQSLSETIKLNRILFFDKLSFYQKKYNMNYDWEPYKKQKGLFSFVPLFSKIVQQLKKEHIYIVSSGRVNISSVNTKNVDYIAEKICYHLNAEKTKSE